MHKRWMKYRAWLLAAAFWSMFGWLANDMVRTWVDGMDDDDDSPAIVEVGR